MTAKYSLLEATERYWNRVDKTGGEDACWPWTGGKIPDGYGMVRWMGRSELAHRVAAMLTLGPIPYGLQVNHLCARSRACCNPKHVYIGTSKQNCADRHRDGTAVVGDKNWMRQHPEEVRRGVDVRVSKLTEGDVIEMRRAHRSGRSIKQLAVVHGVDASTAWHAIRGSTWAHVPGAVPVRKVQ